MTDKNKKLQKKLEEIIPESIKTREGKNPQNLVKYYFKYLNKFQSINVLLSYRFSVIFTISFHINFRIA